MLFLPSIRHQEKHLGRMTCMTSNYTDSVPYIRRSFKEFIGSVQKLAPLRFARGFAWEISYPLRYSDNDLWSAQISAYIKWRQQNKRSILHGSTHGEHSLGPRQTLAPHRPNIGYKRLPLGRCKISCWIQAGTRKVSETPLPWAPPFPRQNVLIPAVAPCWALSQISR